MTVITVPFFPFLLKNRFLLSSLEKKTQNLNLVKKDYKRGLGGLIVRVDFSPQYTKFEVADYIRLTKKQRTHQLDRRANKKIYYYYYLGICLSQKKDPYLINNNTFIIRNVFDRFAVEFNIPIFSPNILSCGVTLTRKKISKIFKAKYFFLRSKPLPKSTVIYPFVTRAHKNVLQHLRSESLYQIRYFLRYAKSSRSIITNGTSKKKRKTFGFRFR